MEVIKNLENLSKIKVFSNVSQSAELHLFYSVSFLKIVALNSRPLKLQLTQNISYLTETHLSNKYVT